jgi:elongation factor Ts
MSISAGLVKELRERTGAGMMECKKALVETNGDIEAAIEHMRKTGLARADKKAGRTAAEGMIIIEASNDGQRAVMLEINSETDFVAKGDDFQHFAHQVAKTALASQAADLDALLAQSLAGGQSIAEAARALIAKLGENINVRRFVSASIEGGVLGVYVHGSRIGVIVEMKGGNTELAKDIAMHVAASRPISVSEKDVPAEVIEKEREIARAQAQDTGKPANIIEKMVDGRIKKFLEEVTLLGQKFVKNPDQTIADLLTSAKAEVLGFQRLEVGEGIEKKQVDFAEEVRAQARGN